MLDRVCMRAAALAMTAPRFIAASTSAIVPLAVMCAATGASAWPVEHGLAATAAFAGAALALAGLLAAARLVVIDWLAEMRSRAVWAAVAADYCNAALEEDSDQSEEAHPAAVRDEVVQAALRAHRHAVTCHAIEPVHDMVSSHDVNKASLSRPARVQQFSTAVSVGRPTPQRPRSGDIGGAELALDRSRICAGAKVTRERWKIVRSSAPVAGASQNKRQAHCGFRLGTQVRRIVNAGAGTWKSSGPTLRVIGVPIKIASDIVVVGQGEKVRSNREAPPGASLNGGPIRAGPPASIAGATESSRGSHRRSQNTTLDLTAVAEAQRRVIALAEALARQAAREDDAAEHLEERSRSPPDMATVEPPRRGAKDGTT